MWDGWCTVWVAWRINGLYIYIYNSITHLVTEGAQGQVGSLGDVEQLAPGRLDKGAGRDGPEAAEHPE